MTDKPTQKEMDDLFVEETGFDPDDFPAAIFGFVRAGLEKWGQPAPQQSAAYAALPDEREAFEAMMRSQTFDSLKRLSDGSYESYEARVGWLAWNVRASHGQAPAQPVAEPANALPAAHVDNAPFGFTEQEKGAWSVGYEAGASRGQAPAQPVTEPAKADSVL